jgi:hypothetical protein
VVEARSLGWHKDVPTTAFCRTHDKYGISMLTEHDALHHLRPFWVAYQSMLKEVEAGGRFHASPQESYAAKQFERLYELEHDLSNLKRATCFIRHLTPDLAESHDIYRYHDEHFSMRFSGGVGKAHQLVGASLLLKADKCSGVNGGVFVIRAIQDMHPEVAACLGRLAALEGNHRKTRQKWGDSVGDEHKVLADHFFILEALAFDALMIKIDMVLVALLAELEPIYTQI